MVASHLVPAPLIEVFKALLPLCLKERPDLLFRCDLVLSTNVLFPNILEPLEVFAVITQIRLQARTSLSVIDLSHTHVLRTHNTEECVLVGLVSFVHIEPISVNFNNLGASGDRLVFKNDLVLERAVDSHLFITLHKFVFTRLVKDSKEHQGFLELFIRVLGEPVVPNLVAALDGEESERVLVRVNV